MRKLLCFVLPVLMLATVYIVMKMTINPSAFLKSPNAIKLKYLHEKKENTINSIITSLAEISLDQIRAKRNKTENPLFAATLSHITYNSVEIENEKYYTVLLLISSDARNFVRRNRIRNSWGNPANWRTNVNWRLVFICGTVDDAGLLNSSKQEAYEHKDMILENVSESFYSLAKKIIIGLTWAQTSTWFGHVLKGDDDVFINIDNVVEFVSTDSHKDGYFGQVMMGQPVERSGRYMLTKEEHSADHFGPYCSGGGFILSQSVVKKTLPLFDFENILRIDDAHVGETIHKAGFTPKRGPGFYMWNDRCEYFNDVMVTHPVKEKKCLNFLMKRSLIDNGLSPSNKTIIAQRYAFDLKHK